MGSYSDKPYKSARIVGDVMGNITHTGTRRFMRSHGPARLNGLSGNYPVDGHGNFGSVIGRAAAMRYTRRVCLDCHGNAQGYQ